MHTIKTHIFAAYKGLTLDLETLTGWKWGGRKKCSMQMEKFLKSCGSILLLDGIDFKINTFRRDKEELYISIKGSIQEEVITTVDVYAPNIGATQYISKC